MKLLLTDLDGTLLNHDKKISPVTRAFLREWLDCGNLFIPSSGRPGASIEEVLRQNEIVGSGIYICAFNGGLFYEYTTGSVIHECRIEMKYVEPVCSLCRNLGLHIHTYENNCIYSEHSSPELAFYRRFIHLPAQIVPSLVTGLTDGPFKLIAIALQDTKRLETLRMHILTKYSGILDCFYSNPNYLEILSVHSGKGAAVHVASEYFHVDPCDIYAFGDEENDITMLQAAGHGVVMCNGAGSVKKLISECTQYDNNHDGIVHYMKGIM